MEIKHVIAGAVILMCVSVSYYFFVALPNQNEAKIALEKQKLGIEQQRVAREQAEKQVQESIKVQEQDQRKSQLLACRDAAIERADKHLELNGTPVAGKPNVFSAPRYIHDEVARIKQQGLDDCQRTYGDLR